MVFTSQIFLFYFLPLVLAGYYALPVRWRNLFLALVSYVFYGWWSPWFVGLMLFSTLVDWWCGKLITRSGASAGQRATSMSTSTTMMGMRAMSASVMRRAGMGSRSDGLGG